jgi:hypothetical protein
MLRETSAQVTRAGAATLARAGDLVAAFAVALQELRVKIIIKSSGLKSR